MTGIELDDVSKVYPDGHLAVHHVDLDITNGELHVLLGPSGCGKSTLLRIIAGLETPTLGEVRFDGERVNERSARDRDVAMAFQTHALYPHMTVAENIGFPLKMAGERAEAVSDLVDSVARMLRLDDVLDRRPGRLSGGQQQRVSLARSIVRDPSVFLMDEPLSNLDARLRLDARSAIIRLQRRLATTTVFVTHDQAEAMTMAHRITVVRDGRAVQTGTPTELYDRPSDVFVATFVGTPQMNVFVATVVERADGHALEIGSSTVALPRSSSGRTRNWSTSVGRRVAVGIRPESLTRSPAGDLVASVRSTESLGPAKLVHAVVDADGVEPTPAGCRVVRRRESPISAMVAPHARVELWEPFRMSVDPRGVHVFDLDTGMALWPRCDPGRVGAPTTRREAHRSSQGDRLFHASRARVHHDDDGR